MAIYGSNVNSRKPVLFWNLQNYIRPLQTAHWHQFGLTELLVGILVVRVFAVNQPGTSLGIYDRIEQIRRGRKVGLEAVLPVVFLRQVLERLDLAVRLRLDKVKELILLRVLHHVLFLLTAEEEVDGCYRDAEWKERTYADRCPTNSRYMVI